MSQFGERLELFSGQESVFGFDFVALVLGEMEEEGVVAFDFGNGEKGGGFVAKKC